MMTLRPFLAASGVDDDFNIVYIEEKAVLLLSAATLMFIDGFLRRPLYVAPKSGPSASIPLRVSLAKPVMASSSQRACRT